MDIIAAYQHGLVEQLRIEAEELAGRRGDFTQRAATYHHLYQHSGGNFTFPLLAAHGALWGAGYFRRGLQLGRLLRWRFGRARRQEAMESLERFADALREINRRVCVETYYMYRLSGSPALRAAAEQQIEPELLEALDRAHAHRRAGTTMSAAVRRDLFKAFFLWEQRTVVNQALQEAFVAFDWPEVHWMARRPAIRFAYLGFRPLRFRNFPNQAERLAAGLAAFDRGERRGWAKVERSLNDYGLMPGSFRANPGQHFYRIQRNLAERRRRQWREASDREPDAVALAA
jgi:hypothetical protein